MADKKHTPKGKKQKKDKAFQPDLSVSATYQLEDGTFHLKLEVRNGGNEPVFLTCGLRRVETLADDTVVLCLSDRTEGPTPEPHPHDHLSVPKSTSLESGESKTIEIERPAQMKRLFQEQPKGKGKKPTTGIQVIDLKKTETILVRISVADAPFYFNPKRSSLPEQTAAWGVDIEVQAEQEPKPSRD